jgi:aldehyde dehydrogenase (NAD+)
MTTTLVPSFLDGAPKRLLISGKWVESVSGKTFDSINPATGEVVAKIAEGEAADVDLAVAAAREAFEGPWSKWKPAERQLALLDLADQIERNYEELAVLETLDMGAPVSRTRGRQDLVLRLLRWYAGQATAIHGDTLRTSLPGDDFVYTLREPVGVVGSIIPWNGPLLASILKVAPVLATGCTVVLKPAEEASLCSIWFCQLCQEVGIPAGVVNLVTGYGETAGAALTAHRDVDKVSFTGSYPTAQEIVRASAGNLKRLSLELGGKAPHIIFADADLEAAAADAATAAFNNAGQVCTAGSRLLVERPIYEEFMARVSAHGERLKIGNGLEATTEMGPLVSEQQLARVSGYLEFGKEEGARTLIGGSRLADGDFAKGYFVPPTVFMDVNQSMRIAQEEIFGPVISAIPFEGEEEAVQISNAVISGLGSGIWSSDISRVLRLIPRIRAGMVWVNGYQRNDPVFPIGGYKMSGYGREFGLHHLDDYLHSKSVSIKIS